VITARRPGRDPFLIGEMLVPAGRTATGELPISRLVTGTQISLPIQIVHGRKPGCTIWLSAAVHGDEIGGVEIIRRVTKSLNARVMSGTVIAVPIVNVHGFLQGDRYLPDRRDLNRAFPGSPNGSLAARIANHILGGARFGTDRSDSVLDETCRAWEFDNEPLIRMRNTYIAPGDQSLEALIANIDDGYLLDGAANGQADANGEFMFGTREAYRIVKGRRGPLLRGVNISGQAFEVLRSVDGVGRDFKWDLGSGHCGKGQPAKVDAGGPWLSCEVVLGGRG